MTRLQDMIKIGDEQDLSNLEDFKSVEGPVITVEEELPVITVEEQDEGEVESVVEEEQEAVETKTGQEAGQLIPTPRRL